MSLSRVLSDRTSPVSRFLRGRFPHVGDLQRRYREPIAHMAPIATEGIAPTAYGTIGTSLDWRLRFLLTPQPNLHIAAAGAAKLGKARMPLSMELLGTLNGHVRPPLGPGRQEPDPPLATGSSGPARLEEDQLVRCCFALALYTEVYRAGPRPGSRLLTLGPNATLEDLLGLASEAEVADVVALADAARRVLLPALVARGTPLHLGPSFVGSPDVGNADADVIAGGLLLEWKATVGSRRSSDGRRYCSLGRDTLDQVLGYLLLDYQDEYAIDTVGVYAARYTYLRTWPAAELLAELAGGPVDVAELRTGFQEAAGQLPTTVRRLRRQRPRTR